MKRCFALFLSVMMFLALSVTACADIGPKASVQITFTGIEGETYYGTLLSQQRSTGPSSAWDGTEEYAHTDRGDGGYEIWEKFVSYRDEDGFYFLQEWWNCSETNTLKWTYRPPTVYKILLYFPESDSFYVSPVCEQYAFDSYYQVDLSDLSVPLQAEKSYDYTWETISLLVRILLTVLLEIGIALLFGYREKRMVRLIAAVNAATQVILNVALNLVNYHAGSMAFTLSYILFELMVFGIEAALFAGMFRRIGSGEQKKGKAVLFALVANGFSFALGMWLSHLIPGIF